MEGGRNKVMQKIQGKRLFLFTNHLNCACNNAMYCMIILSYTLNNTEVIDQDVCVNIEYGISKLTSNIVAIRVNYS